MNKLMNKLILIRGLPGSGKSTLARKFVLDQLCVHYEADMYHMDRGVYRFDGNNIKKAHAWCFESTKIALNNEYSVVVSNTFTRLAEMQNYVSLARDLQIPLEVWKCVGNYGSVHSVPEEVLKKMADRWEDFPTEVEIGMEDEDEKTVCLRYRWYGC